MGCTPLDRLTELEGRKVGVALRGGVRIDECQLVSLPTRRARTYWLFTDGQDLVIPAEDVLDIWELVPAAC